MQDQLIMHNRAEYNYSPLGLIGRHPVHPGASKQLRKARVDPVESRFALN